MNRARKSRRNRIPVDVEFPRLFRQSSNKAFKAALDAGHPVVVASGGAVFRIEKTGGLIKRVKLKDLPASLAVKKDAKITFDA